MGLAASQARYLALTAKMSDVELRGQQINQQRLTLANLTSELYNQLLDMQVPTVPSTQDYTTRVYRFNWGTTLYTIESMVPNGEYFTLNLSYLQTGHCMEEQDDVLVRRDDTDNFRIGDYIVYNLDDEGVIGTGSGSQIDESSWIDYCVALRNWKPEQYGDLTDEELKGKFCVYFETSSGGNTRSRTPKFMEKSEVYATEPNGERWVTSIGYVGNGTYTAYKEIEGCKFEFTSKGAIDAVRIPVYSSSGELIQMQRFPVNADDITDNNAYNDAMNEYEHLRFLYDQEQEKINKKTTEIQAADKRLEAMLKQLDTERNAINTEIDAVKKVIQDATEKGFKTFSG